MRVEQILERLDGVGGSNGQWHARCPAHEDRQASLTISTGDDGRVLLTCWAGCGLDEIVHAMSLDVRDLFPSRDDLALFGNGKAATTKTPPWGNRTLAEAMLPMDRELAKFVARLQSDESMRDTIWTRKGWDVSTLSSLGIGLVGERLSIPVRDLDGTLVNLLRYRPDAHPKMLATKGRKRTPVYYFASGATTTLWLTEGETDAISLAMLGLSVIGVPGASAKARAEQLAPVKGLRVVVCFDADEPGRKASRRWALAAREAGAREVAIVELDGPAGYDVGEFVRETREDRDSARRRLAELDEAARPFEIERVVERKATGVVEASPLPDVAATGSIGEVITETLSSIRTSVVRWLWRERIPVGRVGIVFGPPGHGKSTFTAMLAADVSKLGGRVLIASAEDNAATTITPRMAAAGGVLERIELIATRASKGTTNLVLPRDLDALADRMTGRALLIIDPLVAHLGDDVNAWSEQSVRALVLAPLQWHAARTGCTVVAIMHMNKSDRGDALARISGSGGFGGAARFAFLLGTHPDDLGVDDELAQRLVLVHVKASEGGRQRAIVFARRLVEFVTDEERESALIPTLDVLDDRASIEPETVIASTDPDERGAYTDALSWLRRELANGPVLAKRLLTQSRERGDFSERTLRKAKRALGVTSERDSEGWFWHLPPPEGETP